MTLDPRTQLAHTMLMGLRNDHKSVVRKNQKPSQKRDGRWLEQERRSVEALTKALLDPCATVQEAVLHSLMKRAEVDSPAEKEKDRFSG